MGYIKKEIQNLIKSMDETFSIDSGVRNWLKQSIYSKHNLILKSKDGYYCTNCKKTFHSTARVGEYLVCPKCKESLLVRMNTLKYQVFKDDFRILDYINGYFVLRGFEVSSTYSNNKVTHRYQEYQRLVISKNKIYLLASNVFKNYMGYTMVTYNEKHIRWRLLDGQYRWYMSRGSIYWGELERDLEGSPYYYCPVERGLSPYISSEDIEILLQRVLINPISFELLSKLGLTNLAIHCDRFVNKGSFENRFGVTKDYLPFMVKHNITYHELEVLKVIKHMNIRIIRRLSELHNFTELSKYLDMEKALANGLNKNNEHLYSDYLDFAERLHLNMKDKRILYPKDIVKSHDELMHQVETIENQEIIEKIKNRYEELKKNSYKDDKFVIFPVPTMSDLIKESEVQDICIRNYNKRYADAETDLYFMRKVKDITTPLVAIEVRNNEIIQSRGKKNNDPTKAQQAFITKWETKVLKGSVLYA